MSLMVLPIHPENVTYCAFSDASFSSAKHQTAHQGTLIVATTPELLENEKAVIAPVAWCSKKIARVVRSTLGAEASALANSVDRLFWIRLLWSWIRNPSCKWQEPEVAQERKAALVTDCRSAYDLLTRNAIPQCSEHRTTIECLIIRERLQANCAMRWVASQAMLSDCLTKTMDAQVLRECLRAGKYALRDEGNLLKERADKRQRLKWIRSFQSEEPKEDTSQDVLTADSNAMHDFWISGNSGEIIRVHVRPRRRKFTPIGDMQCPVDLKRLQTKRVTYRKGCEREVDFWVGTRAHDADADFWTGKTVFFLKEKI